MTAEKIANVKKQSYLRGHHQLTHITHYTARH